MNTVSLCMICKNEENNIGKLLDQVCPILEEVVVVDTGSTDSTLRILEEKAKIYPGLKIDHFDWIEDFSAARNYSFSKGTKDWLLFLDCDDQVDPIALKNFKDNMLGNPDVDCWMLDYNYAFLPNGEPSMVLGRERFVRRSVNPVWEGAIHECIAVWRLRCRHYHELKIDHHREHKVMDFNRNVRILKKEYEKNSNHARTAYYYGKELFDRIDDKGIEILEKYLELNGRYWDDEIGARFRLAKHYLSKSRHREAIQHAEQIYHLDASRLRSEGYWIYGAVEKDLRNLDVAIEWFKRCLDKNPAPPRVLSLEYYTWNPLWRISECYRDKGMWVEALEYAFEAKKHLRNDPGLDNYINSIHPPQRYGLKVLELGCNIRGDSHQIHSKKDVLPFIDNYFDGIVCLDGSVPELELHRIVRPGGFMWLGQKPTIGEAKVGYLGKANYRGNLVCNSIKVDESKCPFAVGQAFPAVDSEFGPYRIRIQNMFKAAKKRGHAVYYDYPSSPVSGLTLWVPRVESEWINDFPGIIIALDICEEVIDAEYQHNGIAKAHIITVSSSYLKQVLIDRGYTQPIFVVPDPYEVTSEGWL